MTHEAFSSEKKKLTRKVYCVTVTKAPALAAQFHFKPNFRFPPPKPMRFHTIIRVNGLIGLVIYGNFFEVFASSVGSVEKKGALAPNFHLETIKLSFVSNFGSAEFQSAESPSTAKLYRGTLKFCIVHLFVHSAGQAAICW